MLMFWLSHTALVSSLVWNCIVVVYVVSCYRLSNCFFWFKESAASIPLGVIWWIKKDKANGLFFSWLESVLWLLEELSVLDSTQVVLDNVYRQWCNRVSCFVSHVFISAESDVGCSMIVPSVICLSISVVLFCDHFCPSSDVFKF